MKKNIIYTGSTAYNFKLQTNKPKTNQLAYVQSTQVGGVVNVEFSSIVPGPMQLGSGTCNQKIICPALSSSTDWSGIAVQGLAGEELNAGSLVYPVKSTAGLTKWMKFNCSTDNTAYSVNGPRGMGTTNCGAGYYTPILLNGVITAHIDDPSGTTWLANTDEGKTLYASSVAGSISASEPGTGSVKIKIGWILNVDNSSPNYVNTICFNPMAVSALDYITT